MIGIVVVTHGRLAEELIAAGVHVFGRLPHAAAICIGPDDDMEARRAEILAACEACDQGAGVAILTDMFGGTPSNLAISVMGRGNYEVIAGANLPMLIKLAELRARKSLGECCAAAAEAGRKYITLASAVLAGG
jgi:PTS system mannose-specific IIA component